MEDRLTALITANSEENRAKWAREWKRRGGKVVGLLCSYVPEEIIYAAGMMPWHALFWRLMTQASKGG